MILDGMTSAQSKSSREVNKPDSVIPDKPEPMSIPLGQNSRFGSSCLPESGLGLTIAFLFGIAPDKAFLATAVTSGTGGLLHHHFTLAQPPWDYAVCFCGAGSALLQLPVRKYPAQGVRTFLCGITADIFHSHAHYILKKICAYR